jgi:hypothetical protein
MKKNLTGLCKPVRSYRRAGKGIRTPDIQLGKLTFYR